MYKYCLFLLLSAVLAVSAASCSKKVGCPVNNDTTPVFDGSKRKASKTKSGLVGKSKKYKKRKHK